MSYEHTQKVREPLITAYTFGRQMDDLFAVPVPTVLIRTVIVYTTVHMRNAWGNPYLFRGCIKRGSDWDLILCARRDVKGPLTDDGHAKVVDNGDLIRIFNHDSIFSVRNS